MTTYFRVKNVKKGMGGGYEINLLKSGKIKSYGIGFIEDYSEKGIFGTGKIL